MNMLHKRIYKWDDVRALRWGDYSGLSGWTQCPHKGPYKEKGGRRVRRRCPDGSRGWGDIGPLAEECGQLLDAGKGKHIHPTLEPPEGTQCCQPISDI